MTGPDYAFFDKIREAVADRFCAGCGCYCAIFGCPADRDNCPFHDKWVAIYNDLDQLIARVTEWKEAPRDDA